MVKREIPAEVRAACYKRDHETCQWDGCMLSRLNGDRINLHHILPEQFGGLETPDNLITLCDIHHKNMHVEFHAFYPDSQSVLYKMNRLMSLMLSRIRRVFGVDDGIDLRPYLQYLTGTSVFRPGQLKTIRAALAGKDVLLVSPTGSGKSVCYQLPGLLAGEPSLVISPLKALMKDQVESIWSKKIPTTYINSDLTSEEKKRRYEFIGKHLYKFIFVAPERFNSADPQTAVLYNSYAHFVVDEAHAIDVWGMAFRPSYRRLGELRETLKKPALIALTATASKETQRLILRSLHAETAEVIVTGFYRRNIQIVPRQFVGSGFGYEPADEKYRYIKQVVLSSQATKVIVFVPSVPIGNELHNRLRHDGVDVAFFQSNLESRAKMHIQNRFTGMEKPELNILISTSAFGMGINIPNIRHIIHWAPALNLTDYVQQIGRAGRDGRQSMAHLLYSPKDTGLLRYIINKPLSSTDFKTKHGYTVEDVTRVRRRLDEQLQEMLYLFKQPRGKEWQYILEYFGERKPSIWDRFGINIINAGLIFLGIVFLVLLITLIVRLS